jgi:hypothetical protein
MHKNFLYLLFPILIAMQSAYAQEVIEGEYIVRSKREPCNVKVETEPCVVKSAIPKIEGLDIKSVKSSKSSVLFKLSKDQMKKKRTQKIVEYDPKKDKCKELESDEFSCSPNFLIKLDAVPNDPMFSQQWSLQNIQAQRAFDNGNFNTEILVGVVDTGIDRTHPDLVDNLSNKFFDSFGGTAQDGHGHGTHVSGTIAAGFNNNLGVTGLCKKCKIVPMKVLADNGHGSLFNIINAIDWAINNNIKILNMSLGSPGYSDPFEDSLTDAKNHDILVIAAAGNNGHNTDEHSHYPSGFDLDNIVSVASIDSNGALSSFSNFGVETVDLAAPGGVILSTWPNGKYNSISGTSMATPHVTGVAAAIWSMVPDLSIADLKRKLLNVVKKSEFLTKLKTGGILNFPLAAFDECPPCPECPPVQPCKVLKAAKCVNNCVNKPNVRKCKRKCKKKYCPDS